MSPTPARSLADHPLLSGLPDGTAELMAGCAEVATFDPGSLLLREGDQADTVYLIQSGRVAIEVQGPGQGRRVVETVGPGDVVGLSWIAPPFRWHFDARALDPVRAIGVHTAALRTAMRRDPAIGYPLLERLSSVVIGRLQTTRIRLLDLYGGARA